MKKGIIEDEVWHDKNNRIIWEKSEFESLREDIHKNYNDLTELEPENALNLLRLFAVDMMQRNGGKGSILRQEESELHVSVFGGTFADERGQILWDLLNTISPVVFKKGDYFRLPTGTDYYCSKCAKTTGFKLKEKLFENEIRNDNQLTSCGLYSCPVCGNKEKIAFWRVVKTESQKK